MPTQPKAAKWNAFQTTDMCVFALGVEQTIPLKPSQPCGLVKIEMTVVDFGPVGQYPSSVPGFGVPELLLMLDMKSA